MIQIDTRAALRGLTRDLSNLARTQVPFATALALTASAKRVAVAETEQLEETFDKPTPFTRRAFGVIPARKANLTATIFARDIQAAYLDAYAFGGVQALGRKRVILTPVQLALNQYGNIPRGKLAALKGRPGYFVGDVKLKNGHVIGGLWQRTTPPKVGRRHRGMPTPRGTLKLLIEFTAPREVTKRLPYAQRAAALITRWLPVDFEAAMARALATAR